MATAVLSGAASLAGQVAMLPVTGVQKIYEEYSEMNESSLSGAIDIIAVRQPDGRLKSTPFHVRFGRFSGVLRPADKVVTIKVNDTEVPLQMKLGRSGEACVSPRPTAEPIRVALTSLCIRRYFVHEADVSNELDDDLAVSPIMSPRRASLTGASSGSEVFSEVSQQEVVTPPSGGDDQASLTGGSDNDGEADLDSLQVNRHLLPALDLRS